MKTVKTKRKIAGFFAAAFVVVFALLSIFPFGYKTAKEGGMSAVTATAASDDSIEIQALSVDMSIHSDRKIYVKQKVTVEFLQSGLTMFYQSLPLEGDRYYNIRAYCRGNDEFHYYVADNPDMDGFIDINCVGGVEKGAVWTYDISYIMEIGIDDVENGMSLDVVGFGSAVPLHNVTVNVRLPANAESYQVHTGGYGTGGNNANVQHFVSENVIHIQADRLDVVYNSTFGERMAQGITLEFTLPEGVLEDYTSTRIFTDDMWKIVLGGGVGIILAVLAFVFFRKKREIVTVVNIKAPDEMDPLKMGKWLDGTADAEDITSMIYYFAHQGYLMINLEDEDDPVLIRKVVELPENAPVYQKTLFKGLFKQGERVAVSDLKEKYFETVETAKMQLPKPTMYEPKSIFGFLAGGILGVLFAFLTPLLFSIIKVGGGYQYFFGAFLFIPIALIVFLGYLSENYRYKWKKGKRMGMLVGQIAIAFFGSLIYIPAAGAHLMTGYERFVTAALAMVMTFTTLGVLSRRESYVKTLGDILGFKDFIVYTEEDKIKFMLEENPELYYKVLPYAQVLGVTDEWEEKFAALTIEPPSWCVGYRMTVFDHMVFHRCMRRAMVVAMTPPQSSGTGRSGGGGSFGGFSGGGHGGGGFGAR